MDRRSVKRPVPGRVTFQKSDEVMRLCSIGHEAERGFMIQAMCLCPFQIPSGNMRGIGCYKYSVG